MKSVTILSVAGVFFLPLASAINMTFYAPQQGVDCEFGPFYEALLATNEDPLSTSSFTDFFAPNGTLAVLDSVAQGAEAILASRQAILPVNGSVRWNHFPNTTIVASETRTSKTFELQGIMHAISAGVCSTTYFATRFTVTKNRRGAVNLTPQSKSLLAYDGFRIEGSADPCFATYA